MSNTAEGPRPIDDVEHRTVYRDEGAFAAWPFNVGAWNPSGDEVVAAFIANDCDYSVDSHLNHRRISTYGRIRAARSTDGGRSWTDDGVIADCVETSERVSFGADRSMDRIDPSAPETLLTAWSAIDFYDPTAIPWIRVSEDGGRTWSDPYRLPKFQFERVQARPSSLVRPDGTILLTLTAQAESDAHLRPVAYASPDGGRSWSFLSYIAGGEDYPMICPDPVRLDDGRILAAVRVNPTWDSLWTECYESTDGGRTWAFKSRVNDHGAPATFLDLGDERVGCVYGYRIGSPGIRARVSPDGGETWGRELIIRDGGANADLGYPRTLRLGDDLLTVYYFNEHEADVPADGGIRHIASSRYPVAALLE